MARPYAKLRGLMKEHGDTQKDLGDALLLSTVSVSNRMCCRDEWKASEMYVVMDRYHVPYKMLHVVFPPNGRNECSA